MADGAYRRQDPYVVTFFLLAAVILVFGNSWFAFRSLNQLNQRSFWEIHTYQVLRQLDGINLDLTRAESRSRGYMLTSSPVFLSQFEEARADIPSHLSGLRHLTADNALQQAHIDQLQAAVEARMGKVAEAMTAGPRPGQDAAQLALLTGAGEQELASIRALIAQIASSEQSLLAARTAATINAQRNSRLTLLTASGLDLLLLLLSFRYLLRERRLREESENNRLAAERSAGEVRALNAELESRVRQRTQELELANRELEAFSYSVSHDLRAPLRTIDGFSLALEEDYSPLLEESARDYLHRIRDGVQRMGLLIDSLLQLSRITRAELAREPVDMTALGREVAAGLTEQNPGRDIRFRIQPGMAAMGDARLLRVAVENLLGNAVKFTSKRERAEIDFEMEPGGGAFLIRDNGAGFDQQYAGKLFIAFQRLHGDKDFRGSGIGLATVARVIHRHHGDISARGETGKGATFRFTLG